MKYLLDTNTCIRFINGRSEKIRQRLISQSDDDDIAISVISKAEMYYGSAKSQTPIQSRRKQDEFLIRFRSLPFDDQTADVCGSIRATLDRAGTPIGAYDLMIGATALVHGLILVTHNVREFRRVDNLSIEDWEV